MAATFYVLPSRETLGNHFASFLKNVFPGLDWSGSDQRELSDSVTSVAEAREDVFVVHREDFEDESNLEVELVETYGADKGDLVVEVADPTVANDGQAKLWNISIEAEIDDDDDDFIEDDEDADSEYILDFDDLDEEEVPAVAEDDK